MTLTVGNALSTALRLYRARFAQFLVISLKATAWMGIPFVFLLVGGMIITALAFSSSPSNSQSTALHTAGLAILLIIVYLVLVVFCGAKSFTNETLIARLGISDLLGKPETVDIGWQQIRRRMWHIWLARFMAGIVVVAANYGISLASTLIVGTIAIILRESLLPQLLGNIIHLLGYLLQLWLSARFMIPDVSVAMEQIPGDEAIIRSWNLTKGKDLVLVAIILTVGLMGIFAFSLCFLPFVAFLIVNISLFQAIAADANNANPASEYFYLWQNAIAPGLLWLTVSIALASCLTVLYIPFWQCIRGAIYRDLTANPR